MEYYHAFTRGLEKDLLFYGDAEFLYGMNIIPRYLKLSGTRLLAFCLMDNHVHFVLEGCRAACNQFIINYKRTVFSFLKSPIFTSSSASSHDAIQTASGTSQLYSA